VRPETQAVWSNNIFHFPIKRHARNFEQIRGFGFVPVSLIQYGDNAVALVRSVLDIPLKYPGERVA